MMVRYVLGGMVMFAVGLGALMYYLQVYAFYGDVPAEMRMTSLITGQAEPILVDEVKAIDSDSSPIRFRACFTPVTSLATLTETYQIYEAAEPLNGPGWFDCYDARAIGEALELGDAVAFLGEKNISYGVDRVVVVTTDGRGFAWHQINECGAVVFDGDPPPQGCPTPPKGVAN